MSSSPKPNAVTSSLVTSSLTRLMSGGGLKQALQDHAAFGVFGSVEVLKASVRIGSHSKIRDKVLTSADRKLFDDVADLYEARSLAAYTSAIDVGNKPPSVRRVDLSAIVKNVESQSSAAELKQWIDEFGSPWPFADLALHDNE